MGSEPNRKSMVIMKRHITKYDVHNKNNLIFGVHEAWKNIKVDILENLITSMLRRIAACIAAKG